ncbi:hypothetical protein [Mesorhizobium caraganae]
MTVAQIPQTGADAPDATGAAQQQSVEALAGSRPVRMVGPAYFPAD